MLDELIFDAYVKQKEAILKEMQDAVAMLIEEYMYDLMDLDEKMTKLIKHGKNSKRNTNRSGKTK